MNGPPDLEAGFCVILKRGNAPARSRHTETLGSPHGGGQVIVSSELGVWRQCTNRYPPVGNVGVGWGFRVWFTCTPVKTN